MGRGGFAATMVPASLVGALNGSTADSLGLASSTSVRMRVTHATTYHAAITVWDNLYNTRVCYSNGVLYDDTPPNVSLATLVSHLARERRPRLERGTRQRAHIDGSRAVSRSRHRRIARSDRALAGTPNLVQRVSHLVHAEARGIADPESGVRQYYAAVGASTEEVPSAV